MKFSDHWLLDWKFIVAIHLIFYMLSVALFYLSNLVGRLLAVISLGGLSGQVVMTCDL